MNIAYLKTDKFPSKMGTPQEFPILASGGRRVVGLDIETCNFQGLSALDYKTSTISTLQLSGASGIILVDTLELGGIPAWVRELLEDETVVKIIHNAGFEYKFLRFGEGIEIKNFFCTLIAEQTLKNGLNLPNDYGAVVKRYTGIELPKDQGKSDWGKRPLSKEQLLYMIDDVRYLPDVYNAQVARFDAFNTLDMWDNFQVEMEALPYFCETENNGVYFNMGKVQKLKVKLQKEADEMLERIQTKLPWVPLTDSDKKKKPMREKYPNLIKPVTSNNDFKKAYHILGVDIPLVKDKVTKKIRESLSADTYHLVKHETGPMIQKYTELKKLITCYIDPLLRGKEEKKPGWIHPLTKRAHPNIRQNGTNTARPAYKDPPLQTIPKLKEFRELVEAQQEDNHGGNM